MQGEGQGPEGPNQSVALTISISCQDGQIPPTPPQWGREEQKKMRCGFLLPVAVVDFFSHLLSTSLLQQRRLQGGQKSALTLLTV